MCIEDHHEAPGSANVLDAERRSTSPRVESLGLELKARSDRTRLPDNVATREAHCPSGHGGLRRGYEGIRTLARGCSAKADDRLVLHHLKHCPMLICASETALGDTLFVVGTFSAPWLHMSYMERHWRMRMGGVSLCVRACSGIRDLPQSLP